MKRLNSSKGFTLIELLVVIAIIGILASVILAALNSARAKARDAHRVSEVQQIATAVVESLDQNGGNFPSTGGVGVCLGTAGTCWGGTLSGSAAVNAALAPYLPTVPTDPSGRTGTGDRYIYADASSIVAYHCQQTVQPGNPYGTASPSGPYILWEPEVLKPTSDAQCNNNGFYACCGAISCTSGNYFCAYKIQ